MSQIKLNLSCDSLTRETHSNDHPRNVDFKQLSTLLLHKSGIVFIILILAVDVVMLRRFIFLSVD